MVTETSYHTMIWKMFIYMFVVSNPPSFALCICAHSSKLSKRNTTTMNNKAAHTKARRGPFLPSLSLPLSPWVLFSKHINEKKHYLFSFTFSQQIKRISAPQSKGTLFFNENVIINTRCHERCVAATLQQRLPASAYACCCCCCFVFGGAEMARQRCRSVESRGLKEANHIYHSLVHTKTETVPLFSSASPPRANGHTNTNMGDKMVKFYHVAATPASPTLLQHNSQQQQGGSMFAPSHT